MRMQIMERLKDHSMDELMEEGKSKMTQASQGIAVCKENLKAAENDSQNLQAACVAAMQSAQAAQEAFEANSKKKISIKKEMAALEKVESKVAAEINLLKS